MRRCLDCRSLCSGTRCPACTSARKRVRNADRPVAAAQVERTPYCECRGCRVCDGRPCTSRDLTGEHVTPVKFSGRNDGRRLTLCRRCNSSKRDR